MKVNEKYSVERVDAYNIGITEYRVGVKGASAGKVVGKNIGYYSSWESAFTKLLNMSIESNNVRGWQKELKKATQEILTAIKENKKELQ